MRAERGRYLDGTFPAADDKSLGDEPGARKRDINHRSLRPEPAVDADRAVDLVGFHDPSPTLGRRGGHRNRPHGPEAEEILTAPTYPNRALILNTVQLR